ncbi:hypothetical protein DFH08DRAFT_807017 [Mycena albidolilacea]|uniref:Uncharacterized protein n=1 Tax=Mycena albidolilacea TaxID=1033008 RepID=A0AAD7A521_9AGAR|nr:hypothetical protein DFH08DRAFT_807017 [Mycena albidolilacea]
MFDLVKYDNHTPGKLLPARGTLFSSCLEAIASKCLRWFALNLMLFLLPLLGGSLVMLTLGARLGIYVHKNPHQLAYMLTYLAICLGSANFFIGSYNSRYSSLDSSRSFPVVVDSDTTVEEIYSHLQALGILSGSQFQHFYFAYRDNAQLPASTIDRSTQWRVWIWRNYWDEAVLKGPVLPHCTCAEKLPTPFVPPTSSRTHMLDCEQAQNAGTACLKQAQSL